MKHIRALVNLLALVINTLIWCWPLFAISLIKLIPFKPLQSACTRSATWVAEAWIFCNSLWMRALLPTKFNAIGLETLTKDNWVLVTANHQSWVDILTVQHLCNKRLPFFKFFLKQSLIWVPVLGLCWKALDFPFMKRYTRAQIKRNPALKGKDFETTKKACERFKHAPIAVFNFVEGTRFTQDKHSKQNSQYKYLLKPKAGGVGYVISAMGDMLTHWVDITIHYPAGAPSFYDFISGQVPQINVNIETHPIDDALLQGNYQEDPQHRVKMQAHITDLWKAKDQTLASLNNEQTS